MRAEFILSLCREFHVLPSAVLAEDAELIQLVNIEAFGNPDKEVSDG